MSSALHSTWYPNTKQVLKASISADPTCWLWGLAQEQHLLEAKELEATSASYTVFAFPKCFFFLHQVFYRLSEPLALRSTSPCHQGYSLSIKVSTKYVVLPKHLLKQTDIFKLLGMGLLGCCWVKMSICSSLQLHLKFFL